MQNKLLSLLGLARRAGKLSLGHDPAVESMHTGKAFLVLTAADLSPRTQKSICFTAQDTKTTLLTMAHTMDEIGAALGKRTGVIAVNDAGFANKLYALCSPTDHYREE